MSIFLRGLKLGYYRAIGRRQDLKQLAQFNFFIGSNNSGKSSILSFIHRYLSAYGKKNDAYKAIRPEGLDIHQGRDAGRLSFSLCVDANDYLNEVAGTSTSHRARSHLEAIFEYISEDGVVWFHAPLDLRSSFAFDRVPNEVAARKIIPEQGWFELWNALTSATGGGFQAHWLPETFKFLLSKLRFELPPAGLIPAIREVGPKGSSYVDFSGKGLIDKLAALQNPGYTQPEDKLIFEKINGFLQAVTGEESARIEIPHDREYLLVEMNGKRLPLEALGTGVHDVIMIASFCTLSEHMMICIEEPELHLHPIIQKKLISYLQIHTSNQYFIATHSASFIDTQGARIFHVSNDGTSASIQMACLRHELYNVCFDLGYKASDILQSNAVVWVEGPSDRIYIISWINSVDPSLVEGVDFTIMFYGGRLLSHISFDDSDATDLYDFVSLLCLNRNSAIAVDSDMNGIGDSINSTKSRIIDEANNSNCLSWVTSGREIENYIKYDVLHDAIKRCHSRKYARPLTGGQFCQSLHFVRTDGEIEKDVDKVSVARLVCQNQPDLSVLDLAAKIEELVIFLRRATGK